MQNTSLYTNKKTLIMLYFQCFEDFLREVTGDDVIEQFKTEHVGEYLDIFKEFEVFISKSFIDDNFCIIFYIFLANYTSCH